VVTNKTIDAINNHTAIKTNMAFSFSLKKFYYENDTLKLNGLTEVVFLASINRH
jgi:hypothetical protein